MEKDVLLGFVLSLPYACIISMYQIFTQIAQNCKVNILNFTTAYFTIIFQERHDMVIKFYW